MDTERYIGKYENMASHYFREFTTIGIILYVVSFILNFLWESFHAAFLYTCCMFEPPKYVSVMSYASAIDGLLILGLYSAVALITRDHKWFTNLNWKKTGMFFVSGIIVAAVIEYHAIFIADKWTYSSLMPTIFAIGLFGMYWWENSFIHIGWNNIAEQISPRLAETSAVAEYFGITVNPSIIEKYWPSAPWFVMLAFIIIPVIWNRCKRK